MRIRSFYLAFTARLPQLTGATFALRWVGFCCGVLLTFPSVANTGREDLQSLQGKVETFLEDYYGKLDVSRAEVKVSNLDPRLILPRCTDALRMSVNDPSHSGGNLTVQTRCDGKQAWSIYVPAQVALFRAMAVASRNLSRGDIVTQADISIETVNVSQLRQGYLVKRDNIVGKELQRAMSKGEAFRGASLDSPMVIKRGDEVSIEIQAGMIVVSSSGTAMANGRIGQRIRVRNSQSERIVSAEVVDAGKVKTSI